MNNLLMVFDVESVGLYGEGFAVGYVVVDRSTGQELEAECIVSKQGHAIGTDSDRQWILEHVCPHLLSPQFTTPKALRDYFWGRWLEWREQGATLWADCAYPVEANFLIACVADDPGDRTWKAPYPLHEIASVFLLKGLDPLADYDRLPSEMPKHNPLCDARQSARLLITALL